MFACVDNCRTSRRLPQCAIQRPASAPARGEQQNLDQQLAGEAPAGRAQRQTHAELVLARGSSGQEQIGDVGAGDQEHQRDHGHRHEHRLTVGGPHQRRANGGWRHLEWLGEVLSRKTAGVCGFRVDSRICGCTPRNACSAAARVWPSLKRATTRSQELP